MAFWLATFVPSKRTYQRLLVSFNASLICLPFLPWSWKWKMGPSNSLSIVDDYSYLLNTAIFHFHNLEECVIGFGSRKCHWNVIKIWQLYRTICRRELDSANLFCHMRSQLSPCGDKRTTKNTILNEKMQRACSSHILRVVVLSARHPNCCHWPIAGMLLQHPLSIRAARCPWRPNSSVLMTQTCLESKSVDHIHSYTIRVHAVARESERQLHMAQMLHTDIWCIATYPTCKKNMYHILSSKYN